MAVKPCFCGNYGNVRVECRCSVKELQKYFASKAYLDARDADIVIYGTVEYPLPSKYEHAEDFDTVMARVKAARSWLADNPYQDTAVGQELLKFAIRDLNFGQNRIDMVKLIAHSVAALDHEAIVMPRHLSEAVQYMPRIQI